MHTVGYKCFCCDRCNPRTCTPKGFQEIYLPAMPCFAGARVLGLQIKPPTPRNTSAAAVPADVPAFICTQQSGVVTCTDEAGSPVQGEQLKQLQALLKPIADAPALADEPVKAKAQSMPAAAASDAKMVAQKPESAKPPAPTTSQVSASAESKATPSTGTTQAPSPPTAGASIKSVSDLATPSAPVSEPQAATPASKSEVPARSVTKKTNPPITLATPDLSAKSPGSDVRAYAVSSRGNDESVNFSAPAPPPPSSAGSAARSSNAGPIPGNSSAEASVPGLVSPAPKTVARSSGSFPGNVDPADYLPVEEFGKTTVASVSTTEAKPGPETKKLRIVNDKGLIPGNLQMELGEIVNLLQAVNDEPIKYLNYKVYPGNVPPDAPQGTPASTVLEFSPGNVTPKGGDMTAVKMELAPGNIPPDLGDMLEFLKGSES